MEIIILIITNIIAPVFTGVISWLMAKKKYNAEVDNTIISNMKESLEFYKTLSDDNKARLEAVQEKNSQLEKEVSELKTQLLELSMSICLDLNCKYRVLSNSAKNRAANKSKKERCPKEEEEA